MLDEADSAASVLSHVVMVGCSLTLCMATRF
jgi:hypothetical protein